MANLPKEVQAAWKDREEAIVFATVSPKGVPNAIYATCVNMHREDEIVIADNYLAKTKQNIQSGSLGAVLFLTCGKKSYQIKGRVEYHTKGEIFEEMKRWNPIKHPGHAAAVIHVEEVYSGSKRLL